MLLADHVLVPDPVFSAVANDLGVESLKNAVDTLLQVVSLIETGNVIPVPPGVALAIAGKAAESLTEEDVANKALTDWIRSQLILEGPTAREAVIFRAIDDTDPHGYTRLLAHRREIDDGSGTFVMVPYNRYDPGTDYRPFIAQSEDDAVSYFIQRLNERAITGDVFGAEYVTASPFEARILKRKSHRFAHPAEAAVWAEVPYLPGAEPNLLAKALKNEDAVEDLRAQLRAALTARGLSERSDALTNRAADIEAASRALEVSIRKGRTWQGLVPVGASTAAIAVGGLGALPSVGVGALGVLGSLSAYLSGKAEKKRSAAYLFIGPRRAAVPTGAQRDQHPRS